MIPSAPSPSHGGRCAGGKSGSSRKAKRSKRTGGSFSKRKKRGQRFRGGTHPRTTMENQHEGTETKTGYFLGNRGQSAGHRPVAKACPAGIGQAPIRARQRSRAEARGVGAYWFFVSKGPKYACQSCQRGTSLGDKPRPFLGEAPPETEPLAVGAPVGNEGYPGR